MLSCHNKQQPWVSFADQPGIEKEINTPIAVSDSSQNLWHMPTPINLDSSGLHCSSRTPVLNRRGKVYSNTTFLTNQNLSSLDSASTQRTNLRSTSSPSFKSALVLFSTICAFGYGLACMAHSLQEKFTVTSTSMFLNAIDSYHCVNTLYDGMINCFSMLAQSSIASNETFSYNQALKQADFCEFIKAMMVEVNDHESRSHWTLIKHWDLPPNTKTIMRIWSFKCKRYPDGTLIKHKSRLCAHGGMQT